MSGLSTRVRARVPAVRGRLLPPLVRFREMRFPTFAPAIHESIATSDDYFRYATLGLALERLRTERIAGALAEVGVWRGETSAFLHRVAPERRLYLFDTFEGFSDKDLPAGSADSRFRDTSAEAVRRLTELFEWARFSHHEPEPSMRDDAVDALIAVRDELRHSELVPA